MRPSPIVALVLGLLGGACGPAAPVPASRPPPAAAPTAAPAAAPAVAPPPYSAEQIRAATRPGRTYEWRIETPGQAPLRRLITFLRVTPEGGETEATTFAADGRAIDGPTRTAFTWPELRRHAEFRSDAVRVTEEQVEVPAGTFLCRVYAVTRGATVTRFYFAPGLPGPPVLFYTEQNGQRTMTTTLVGYQPGD